MRKIRISCVGDSNTDGWPGELNYTPYTEYLQKKLGSSYKVMNYGKFNTTVTFSMDDPFIYNEVYRKALSSKPDIVTIMLGSNDCKDYNWNAHGRDFKKDFVSLVDIFAKLATEPRIVLCTPPPILPDNYYKLNSGIMENNVAPAIRETAEEKGLELIDVNRTISQMDDLALFDKDRLHLNKKGHETVSDIIYPYIIKNGD